MHTTRICNVTVNVTVQPFAQSPRLSSPGLQLPNAGCLLPCSGLLNRAAQQEATSPGTLLPPGVFMTANEIWCLWHHETEVWLIMSGISNDRRYLF